MKNILIIYLLSIPLYAQAQFVVGSQGMTIQNGALVSIDSLVLQPSADLSFASNALQRSSINQPIGSSGNTIDRIYTFTSPIMYNGIISFSYENAELAGNTEASLEMAYSATNTSGVWITTTGSTLNTIDNNISQSFTNTAISQISASNASPLPVTLIEFIARKDEKDQKALLYWNVANELNLSSYSVERSANGFVFTQIGIIKAKNLSRYDFVDDHPEVGANFYRLQMVNLNGTYSYSPVRTLSFGDENMQLNVYPNPVKEEAVTIHVTDKILNGMSGQVTDLSGKIVTTFQIADEKTVLDTNNWMPGTYLIKLTNEMIFKIVKL